MTSSTRALLAAALVVVLSAATLTAAAATPTTAPAAASATVTPSGGSGTFAITITDQAYNADDSKYLGVAPGASAPSTIAKVQVEAKNLSKDLLGTPGLAYSIRDSCTASAAWDAQGRKSPATSGADWSAFAAGDLSGKYGPLSSTKSVSNGNFITTQNQVNNDQASATRVIMDPTLSAAALNNKSLVLTDASGKQVGCEALSVSGASNSSSNNGSNNNGANNGSSNGSGNGSSNSGSGDTKSSAAGIAAPVSSAVAAAAAVVAAIAAFVL